MKLTLDGEALELSLDEGATLAEALTELRNKAGKNGRLLVSATLDGQDIPYEGEDPAHKEPLAKYENLAVKTDTSKNVCLKVLTELQTFEKPLLENQNKAAKLLEQRSETATDEGIAILQDCFDVWNISSESIRKVSVMLALNPEEIQYEGKAVSLLFDEYGKLVLETKTAIEAKKLPKLAKLIKENWQKEAATWQGVIRALIKVVEGLS